MLFLTPKQLATLTELERTNRLDSIVLECLTPGILIATLWDKQGRSKQYEIKETGWKKRLH